MRETSIPSEFDLALVHALQLQPRASWSELAPLLGVTSGTLARRWERLTAEGLAWVYAAPGRAFSRTRCTAFVLLRCRPGARQRLAEQVSAFEEVVTVELTAPGTADLLLDVLVPDVASLTHSLTERLAGLPGVSAVECLFATSLYTEGSRWRLHSLDSAQRGALGPPGAGPRGAASSGALDDLDRALLDALVRDGRLGLAALGERIGTSAATVRRRVHRLIDSEMIAFRCDMAPRLTGLPVSVTFRGQVPTRDLNTLHRTPATLPECRLVAAVTGTSNVLATFWLRDIGDVQRRETAMCARLPSLTVVDRIVGVRTVKRMGHLLDGDGRRTGTRPIRPW
ncbi:Lrp/AsnC family transcriptional regulator [Streptomyces sp. 6-11-2]|uniref:Lrp/AsnC family transcriptional regulator n=1 Tax=Streptomyces sp. 6-11-2 TaxID=2585753 RepID=UPI0011759D7D|nr:AsnC family transcriptional regulator [Streptomyces sp. 6-11-2]GED84290.1 AsnC family transcriptional regulator [Streptomyces sp. 6-11-2]